MLSIGRALFEGRHFLHSFQNSYFFFFFFFFFLTTEVFIFTIPIYNNNTTTNYSRDNYLQR